MLTLNHHIAGQDSPPAQGHYLDVFEPATGAPYARLAAGTANDVELAVQAARTAFPAWAATPVAERARLLNALADALEREMDLLAEAESRDTGKPVSLARSVDIPRAVKNFRFFAGAILHQPHEAYQEPETGAWTTVHRVPVGPVACISPWNLPLYLLTWKVAPALAAGCTVVAKPSEITPLTAWHLGRLATQVGFPAGVLNILQGRGHEVGEPLVTHPEIKAITFTGGTATGKRIAHLVSPQLKKIALELGGKNPAILFADAPDYARMVSETVRSSFSNQGQICLCTSRLLVQNSLYAQFKQDFVTQAVARTPADPALPTTVHGALVSEAHLEKQLEYIRLAKAEGATILTGGEPKKLEGRCAEGWFLPPTVLEGLPIHSRVNQEEIFGPIVTLMPFSTDQEALQLANATPYGLAATLWTGSAARQQQLGPRIQSGIVWVNCWMVRDLRIPFGGMKQSGLGREGGSEALHFFTEAVSLTVQ